MALRTLARLFARDEGRESVRPLYRAIVIEARRPHWYEAGEIADTIDGRFDMVTAVLALVIIQMEALGDEARSASTLLTEAFVEDMDGQLREIGIGDIVVGKHIGRMMGALGGRLGAYREAFSGGDLDAALTRNLYRGLPPAPEALAHVKNELLALDAQVSALDLSALLAGQLE